MLIFANLKIYAAKLKDFNKTNFSLCYKNFIKCTKDKYRRFFDTRNP
jgi:hypothetical protein